MNNYSILAKLGSKGFFQLQKGYGKKDFNLGNQLILFILPVYQIAKNFG